MRKILMILFVLIVTAHTGQAVLHEYDGKAGAKKISYLLIPQASNMILSAALNYDYSLEDDRTLEISYLSYRRWQLIPENGTVQLGFNGKQKLSKGGFVDFTGILGLGVLYSQTVGAVFSPNFGAILGLNIIPGLKFAVPMVLSVYSDPGFLLDYSAGFSFAPQFLGEKQILGGFKGTLLVMASSTQGAFENTFYYYGGMRINL